MIYPKERQKFIDVLKSFGGVDSTETHDKPCFKVYTTKSKRSYISFKYMDHYMGINIYANMKYMHLMPNTCELNELEETLINLGLKKQIQ